MGTRNPYAGSHPDLLPAQHRYPPRHKDAPMRSPGEMERLAAAASGLTPVYVPLSSLTHDQIVHTPRSHFSDDEWLELDDDDREAVLDNDPASQARIEPLVGLFVDRARGSEDPENEDHSTTMESFEEWLAVRAREGDLWKLVPRDLYRSLVRLAESQLFGEDGETAVDEILNSVLADNNHYRVGGHRDPDSEVWNEPYQARFYVEADEWESLIETPEGTPLLYPDELQRAIDEINKANGNLDVPDDMFEHRHVTAKPTGRRWEYWKHGSLDRDWDSGDYVRVYAEWDSVKDDVEEAIAERAQDTPSDAYALLEAAPPEERVVHRWPDGFYVQDLLVPELADEGKIQGMCVGKAEYGYPKALARGEIKILSLRRPSGKPLFTFEASLNGEGAIDGITQIKGKANRLPGFDLGKVGDSYPIKRDEIQRVYQFLEGPLRPLVAAQPESKSTPLAGVYDIDDLAPAAEQVDRLFLAGDPWARKLLTDLGLDDFPLISTGQLGPRRDPRRQNPGPTCGTHGHACTGFCKPYQRRRQPNPPPPGSKFAAALERRRQQGPGVTKPPTAARPAESRSLAQDRAQALEWAQRLAAILVKHGLPARAWQPPTGGTTRVYVGGQHLTVSYGGDPSGTLRGYATFRESVLYPKQRAAYQAAMAEYRRSRELEPA